MDKGGVGDGKRTASSNGSDPSLLQGPPAKKEMRRIGPSSDVASLSSSRKAKLRDEAASGDAL